MFALIAQKFAGRAFTLISYLEENNTSQQPEIVSVINSHRFASPYAFLVAPYDFSGTITSTRVRARPSYGTAFTVSKGTVRGIERIM